MHPKGRDENGVDIDPESYDVDAFVVGGEDGVFAAYWSPQHEGLIDYAQGDDGHWWFAGRYSPYWIADMREALKQAANSHR